MRDEWDDNSLKRTTYPSIARPGVKTIPNPDSRYIYNMSLLFTPGDVRYIHNNVIMIHLLPNIIRSVPFHYLHAPYHF